MPEYISKGMLAEVITRVEGIIIRRALNYPTNSWRAKTTEQLLKMITLVKEGIATADSVSIVRCSECDYYEIDDKGRSWCENAFEPFLVEADDGCTRGKCKEVVGND